MSAEELMEKLEKYLDTQEITNEEEYNEAVLKFMETVNDISGDSDIENNILFDEEEVYYSIPEDSAKRIALKTLEKDPKDYEARNYLTSIESNVEKKLKLYEETLSFLKEDLEIENILNNEDYLGHFWTIPETRPYLRTKYLYILTLIEMKKYADAINECEELLKLSNSDNLGIRYVLANLYCLEDMGEKLFSLYNKYQERTIRMLIPLAIYYYKNNNYSKVRELLELINEENSFFIDYIKGEVFLTDDEIEEIEYSNSYLIGTLDEIYIYLIENFYLINSVNFVEWIKENY